MTQPLRNTTHYRRLSAALGL